MWALVCDQTIDFVLLYSGLNNDLFENLRAQLPYVSIALVDDFGLGIADNDCILLVHFNPFDFPPPTSAGRCTCAARPVLRDLCRQLPSGPSQAHPDRFPCLFPQTGATAHGT